MDTSPRFTGPQRPAAGGKSALVVAAVVVIAGVGILLLWLLTGPTKTYGDQAREVRREKARDVEQQKAEFADSIDTGDSALVSREFTAAMKFAADNPDAPEAVAGLEEFLRRYPAHLHSSIVKKRLEEVKARQAASELGAISKRAAEPQGRYAELIAEVDAWLLRHPSHTLVGAARSLKERLNVGEMETFREAMARADSLSKSGDWDGALAELDRAVVSYGEALAAEARKKRSEIEELRDRASRDEQERLARERSEAEKRRKEAAARDAFAGAVRAALDAIGEMDFGAAREALMAARAPVRGAPQEKEIEQLISGVELAKGALASLPRRFKPEARLEVTRAGTRTPVSVIDENGVTVTIETHGRKLDFPVPWKRLSAEDLYSVLSLLADWKDPDYLVGAALLCMASEKPDYAKSFLMAAAKRTDVSLYERLAEGAPAPEPEEAAPEAEPEVATVPPAEDATAPAGEVPLDLSSLEEVGGQWDLQGGKLVGRDGSVRMRIAGLERIAGVFSFGGLDGSAEVTAGRWSFRFLLAQKQLACGAGGGRMETTDLAASLNTPYAWSITLEQDNAVFKLGAKELARLPSQPQDGQLWFTLITNSQVTIGDVRYKQSGKTAPQVKPKPAPVPAGTPTPTPLVPTAAGKQLDGWTVGEGTWDIDEQGVLTGSVTEGTAWVSRSIRKPFVIEAELEGRAHMAGISFGQAKEFMIVPAGGRQTIVLEVKDSIRFLVDGQETSSAGFSVRASKPSDVGTEFRLEVREGRVSFRVKTQEG